MHSVIKQSLNRLKSKNVLTFESGPYIFQIGTSLYVLLCQHELVFPSFKVCVSSALCVNRLRRATSRIAGDFDARLRRHQPHASLDQPSNLRTLGNLHEKYFILSLKILWQLYAVFCRLPQIASDCRSLPHIAACCCIILQHIAASYFRSLPQIVSN